MNLRNKKRLIARTLGVGVGRISLNSSMNAEIKEAITKLDIIELKKEGVIKIKPIRGVKIKVKKKTKRRGGSIKMRMHNRKVSYMNITRKLRVYIQKLKQSGKITNEQYYEIRKRIKARLFKDFTHFREQIREMTKWNLKEDKKIKQITMQE